jgi:hypothetical protein
MPVVLRPVEFAGENPCVVLYSPNSEVMTAISYWRSDFSASGAGQALFALLRTKDDTLKSHVYTDRMELVPFLATFNQHFKGFEQADLGSTLAQKAEFRISREDDSVEMRCISHSQEIGVIWHGLGTPFVTRTNASDFGGEVGRSYEISSVIRPAKDGAVFVDGKKQPGAVVDEYGGLPRSAFLALCETWTPMDWREQ